MTEMLMEQARTALRDGRNDDAQALLINVIVKEPERDEAWLLLAEALSDPGKKRECLERARAINPRNRAILRALGQLEPGAQREAAPPALDPEAGVRSLPGPSEEARAPESEVDPLLEWGTQLGKTLMLTIEPGDTRQVGTELLRVLDNATTRDPLRARRWARSSGREALWKFQKVLTGTISSLPRDDPQLGDLRELRQRALSFLR